MFVRASLLLIGAAYIANINNFSVYETFMVIIGCWISLQLSSIAKQIESIGAFLDASSIAGRWDHAAKKYTPRDSI